MLDKMFEVSTVYTLFELSIKVVKGVGLGPDQSDCSIGNFSQSESRIWPT